jgi:hypothetical protein
MLQSLLLDDLFAENYLGISVSNKLRVILAPLVSKPAAVGANA